MKVRGTVAALAALTMMLAACGEDIEFVTLNVGECFDNPQMDGSGLTDVDIVDCAESHVGEVFATTTAPDGEFPGEAALAAQAEGECLGSAFESYVGVDYNSSAYYVIPIFPSEASWDAGDRVVHCVLADGNNLSSASPVEGSLRGTGR